jgi:hypothetical protein
MSNVDALPTIPCPNCRQQMQTQDLEQNYHGAVRVDLCFTCGAGLGLDLVAIGIHAIGRLFEGGD